MTPEIVIVAALARDRAIGRNNTLPWRIREDLRRFRALTTGHAVIMGRKTWESLGCALPERSNIVITRDPSWRGEQAIAAGSLDAALAVAARERPGRPAMVIGGAQIYALALPRAARLELTEVALDVPDADAWFPEIDRDMWRVVGSEAIRTESAIELNFYTMIKNNY